MEKIANALRTQTEKELDLNLDVTKKCNICGQSLYKKYNICNIDRIMRISCECEKKVLEEKTKIDEAKEKQLRIEKLLTNSLIDKKFRNSTFENWDYNKGTKQMHELGTRYAKNFKRCREEGLGLLIYGEPGNGKTYLSSAIANKLLENFVPVICVSINGLLSRIQETYNKWGKEAESDIIRGLCDADLLIIDDLGTEKRTE
ncbi:MAG TPA: DnaA/Hda family protein, partial [Clostridium sp.]